MLLDAGEAEFDPDTLAAAIRAALDGTLEPCGQDRNAVCFEARLPDRAGIERHLILKTARLWPGRTNPDTTFAAEAGILARLGALGVGSIPRLMGRMRWRDAHVLLMTRLPGRPPHPLENPLSRARIAALLRWCLPLDALGFLHYDLNPANLLVEGDEVRIVDFEFGRFEERAGEAPTRRLAWCADFNAGTNPHWPVRSNLANCEFRTLHFHLESLAAAYGNAQALDLLCAWVEAKAVYHRDWAAHLRSLDAALAGATAAHGTRERLSRAIDHEEALILAYAAPDETVLDGERSLVAARFARFMGSAGQAAQALAAASRWVAAQRTVRLDEARRAHASGIAWAIGRLVAMAPVS